MTGKFHLSIQSLGQIEKEISASRDYLTNIIDAIASPVFVKDAEHRLILVNNAECTLAGHSREELLGQTDYDFFPKEQVDKFWEIDNQVLDSGEPNENEERITDAAGRILTIVTHKSRYVDQLGNRFIVGVIRDITEAKRMETALRESEQLFRTLTENSPNIIIRYDREYRRIYVNPSYTRKTGIASDLVLNVVFDNQWPPDMSINAKAYKAKLQQVMETGVPAEVLLEWPCQESGQVTSHLVQVVAEKDTDGRITGCLAIGHDISRLKQAELRMNMLAEASPGVLFNILLKQDGTSCLPYVSHRIEELSGLRPEEMSEDLSKVIARIHPDDEKRVRRSIVDSAARLSSWHSEFRMLHPSKGEVWVEGRSIPELMHNGDIHFNGFLHDITERKKMDELLREKREKLESMAVDLSLAEERERRRIATELHDHIGQILLLCRIKLGTLSKMFSGSSDEGTYDDIRTLLDQTIRDVRSLTQQLSPPLMASAGLEAALEWLAKRTEADYSLRVDFVDDGSTKPLSEELRAVVFQSARELLINVAKHAGTGQARLSIGREADMLLLMVEDQGAGFACPPDQSTNMPLDCSFGLINIWQRIKHLGGELIIESSPGLGTRATIRAPLKQS